MTITNRNIEGIFYSHPGYIGMYVTVESLNLVSQYFRNLEIYLSWTGNNRSRIYSGIACSRTDSIRAKSVLIALGMVPVQDSSDSNSDLEEAFDAMRIEGD